MLQGDTRNLPLTGLFQTLEMGQEDGVLTVYFQRMERYFLLRNRSVLLIGERAGSSPNLQSILAGLRILKRQEYDNVLSTISSPCAPGDALLQCKLITADQVLGPVREQILESIYEIFEWRGARYRFEVTKIPPERQLFSDPEIIRSMEFPIQSILMEVARREDEWSRIRAAIPHAHQIYRVIDREHLSAFTTPEVPDEARMQELLKLFDGEHPLTSVLNDSAVPAFYVFSILRTLLEKNLAAPVSLNEKKSLAERLRNRRQTARMAEIYRSILEEDPEDDEMRRRLVFILEKKRENTRELVDHYFALSEGARRRGDLDGQHVLLRRQIEMAPKDLSIHERVLGEFGLTGNARDVARLLHGYVEQAMKLGQEGRAAEFLFTYSEGVQEKSPIYEKAGDLLGRQGQAARATEAYENAMRTVGEDARSATVRRVAEKLRKFDPRSADKWLKRVGVERKTSKNSMVSIGRIAAIFFVSLCAFAGIHEWKAFHHRDEMIANAERALKHGELEKAREEFDKFKEQHPVSFATLSLTKAWEKLSEEPRTIRRNIDGEVIEDPNAGSDPKEEFDYERLISEARDFRSAGDYDSALVQLEGADEEQFPWQVRGSVRSELLELRTYLTRAESLSEQAHQLEERGNLEKAGELYQQLIVQFPNSNVAKTARLPLLLDVLPPHATLILDGRRIEPPFEVHVPGEYLIDLRAEAPGFDSFQQILDPKKTLSVTAHLQRQPVWKRTAKSRVDARPLSVGDLLIVGGRDGAVTAYRASNGAVAWRFPIEGIGDVVGGFRTRAGDLLFASTDGAVYRLRVEDGSQVFRLPLPDGGLPRGECSEIGNDGRCAVITSTATLHWIDVDRGTIQWQKKIQFDGGHSPIRIGNRLIIGADSGNVVCIDSSDQSVEWETSVHSGFSASPAAASGVWVAGTRDHRLVALRVDDGKLSWELPVGSEPVDRCEIEAGKVCLTTRAGSIVVAHLEDGSLDWNSGGHPGFRRSPLVVSNRVVTVDADGHVLVHRLSDGQPLWSYSCGAPSGAPIGGDSKRALVIDGGPTMHLVPLRTEGDKTSRATDSSPRVPGRFAGR